MSDGMPPEDPFGGLPFLADLMKLIQGQGAGSADTARQLAHTIANDGQSESNIDPTDRIAVEQLVRVAELQVAQATDLAIGPITVEVGNRSQWADRTIADYRPLFETLSSSMAGAMQPPTDLPAGDPMAAMMGNLAKMMGPMMLGMTTGTMVGHLARRAMGGYELPVPRPADQPLVISLPNVDSFGDDWSIDRDDLRLWVCLHEVTHHAVMSVPHVRERLTDLLQRHADAFETDPDQIGRQLGGFDPMAGPEALAELQSSFSDPDVILGAVRSPAQEALQPDLTALVAAITGYVDWVMDAIGGTLISSYPMVTEALRRRRVEADASDRFVERILGLELDAEQYDRGSRFAEGVIERAGPDGLRRLFTDPDTLPTPSEVDAPGLWLARIDLPENGEPPSAN
ncbi:MAG: zinc-dependent metalloprotease [Actinomycetota bacterium]